MGRRLIATVYVGDVAYGPDSDVPDDVAAQITNPAAWSDEDADTAESAAGVRIAASRGAEPATGGDRAELEALTKADLVALADARGVAAHGSKAELVERLSSSG